MNTQRDGAADEIVPLAAKPRLPAERLFGSIAAWINNVLIAGHSVRFNCEWVSDSTRFYIVQIDAEDEDLVGVNPVRRRITPVHEIASWRRRSLLEKRGRSSDCSMGQT